MKTKKQLAIQVCEYLHERALKEDEEHKKKARAEKRSADGISYAQSPRALKGTKAR